MFNSNVSTCQLCFLKWQGEAFVPNNNLVHYKIHELVKHILGHIGSQKAMKHWIIQSKGCRQQGGEFHISHNASLPTILSTAIHHVISSVQNGRVRSASWQATEFTNQRLLYLYYVDFGYAFHLTIPSLPFLKLNCVFGHVSFPASLSERRMVVFPRSQRIEVVKDVASPCVIVVISSVNFKVKCFPLLCKVWY